MIERNDRPVSRDANNADLPTPGRPGRSACCYRTGKGQAGVALLAVERGDADRNDESPTPQIGFPTLPAILMRAGRCVNRRIRQTPGTKSPGHATREGVQPGKAAPRGRSDARSRRLLGLAAARGVALRVAPSATTTYDARPIRRRYRTDHGTSCCRFSPCSASRRSPCRAPCRHPAPRSGHAGGGWRGASRLPLEPSAPPTRTRSSRQLGLRTQWARARRDVFRFVPLSRVERPGSTDAPEERNARLLPTPAKGG